MASGRNLQELPRFGDGWTFLYVEKVRVEREENGIVLWDERGRVHVPTACLSTLMLGPGAAISHAAMSLLAANGSSVLWCGEASVRLYAAGLGETRSAANLMHQAEVWADPERRAQVVRRLYAMRFEDEVPEGWTIEQVRGREGVRVRDAYARASRETGIPWTGRSYKPGDWGAADPVNRALSAANACLYGVCHAALVSTGFSTGLGFIHTGKLLSFVYDVADLYKTALTVPIAFREVAGGTAQLESRVRRACRAAFYRGGLLERLVPDIQSALGLRPERAALFVHGEELDADPDATPGALWDPALGAVRGGRNFGTPEEGH
ncbi:MAG: type I-E CRISPR-associated endonuclease Cas1e [Candidatus Methylomirabilis sp.]|nr:type I-E CRISPR-associated endonuclease Cas1e [Deltaproteobacteria bacterium]